MQVSAHRAFALLKELAYEKVSCSPAERRAAERILAEAKQAGVEANLEEFSVACGRVDHAKLVVTAPYRKEYEVTGYERAAATPEDGLDAEFYYAENVLPVHLAQCRGKIVLINGRLRRADYEKLTQAGAAAVLTFSGSTIDRLSESDCDIRKLREQLTEPFGALPAMNLRAADAAEIVRRGATTMHLELSGENYEGTSQNVCAVIPGTTYPDEIISFGAHYDSVYFSTGVYDNISGSVILLELMRYFAEHRPARTLKFNWFGSEEQGLLGSKAWVAAHEDELSRHRLMINIDVAAPTLGQNSALIMANDNAVGYVDALMMEHGTACRVTADIYSSDSVSFTDRGVPAINLCRFGAPGAGFIHDRRDNLKSRFIDERALDITLQQALFLSCRIDSAKVFPIAREIAEPIRRKVDEYLFKTPEKK
ncbi:MAG: M28 family peptidase [Ruminococcaceae bacterium]|nr:M28 family peptidase [Oscillospiraceae bacterium]